MLSCQTNDLDISKIEPETSIGKTLQDLGISRVEPQKGHWELAKSEDGVGPKLMEDGSTTTFYILREKSDELKVNYSGINLEENTGGKLAESNDKLVFANFSLQKEQTFEAYQLLKKSLGPIDQIIYDSISDNRSNTEAKLILSKFSNKEIRFSKDEYDDPYIVFPLHTIWVKGDYIYKYTFLRGREIYRNELLIISKKALRDKTVFGYHNPDTHIFKKYKK